MSLTPLLEEIRACTVCAEHLPLGPRPIIRAHPSARLMLIGQAPGTKVHETGIPWNDASGDRLRDWLGIGKDVFYDETRIAIMPMGFCYPGTDKNGGDNPPRPECAPLWHDKVWPELPNIELTILIGQYAQKRYLGREKKSTMTETVANWRRYAPRFLPLPHPSWRTLGWQKKNPWFDAELLPALRQTVQSFAERGT